MASHVDEGFVKSSAEELRRQFEPWRRDLEEFRSIESARPMGYSGTARLSRIAATRLEQAQAAYTEFASGKLVRMRQNYVGRMINAEPKIEAFAVSDDRAEQSRMEALLHVATGMLASLDERVARYAMGTSWRRLVAESSAFPGKIIGRPWVRQGPNGSAIIECEVFDPLQCWHDFNTWPRRFGRDWQTGALDARRLLSRLSVPGQPDYVFPANLRLDKEDSPVLVTELWVEEEVSGGPNDGGYDVWRAMLINGEPAGKAQRTGFDHLPIVIISTHAGISSYSSPYVGGANGQGSRGVAQDAIINHAQPFYSSLKHTHEQFKAYMSTAYEGLARGLNPALHIQSAKGLEVPEEAMTAGGRLFTRDEDAVNVSVINQGVAQVVEIARICQELFAREYNEQFDLVLLGQSSPGDSGFLNVQKTSHAQAVLHEPASACATFTLEVFKELLHQFGRRQDWSLTLRDRKTRRVRGFSPADMPEDPFLSVEWKPDLGNSMQQIAAAQQLIALGLPTSEVWTRTLDITNPQELMERASQEQLRNHPAVLNANVLKFFQERWLEAADQARRETSPELRLSYEIIANSYMKEYRAVEMQLQGGQAQGQGTPAQPPGIPPQVMPPEMGPQNPDMQAAALGQQSSYTGGPGPSARTGSAGGEL